jgi:hypothetical protein
MVYAEPSMILGQIASRQIVPVRCTTTVNAAIAVASRSWVGRFCVMVRERWKRTRTLGVTVRSSLKILHTLHVFPDYGLWNQDRSAVERAGAQIRQCLIRQQQWVGSGMCLNPKIGGAPEEFESILSREIGHRDQLPFFP